MRPVCLQLLLLSLWTIIGGESQTVTNPKCCICFDNCLSTITRPDVIIQLPEDPRLPNIEQVTCEQIRLAAEDLLLIPEELCPELNRPDLQAPCGCQNYLEVLPPVAPVVPSPLAPMSTPSLLPPLMPTPVVPTPTVTPAAPALAPMVPSPPVPMSMPSLLPPLMPIPPPVMTDNSTLQTGNLSMRLIAMENLMNGTVKLSFEAECSKFFLDQLPLNFTAVACVVGAQMIDMIREGSLLAQAQINAKTTDSALTPDAFEKILQTLLNNNGTVFVAQLKDLQDAESKVAFATLTSITALAEPTSPPIFAPTQLAAPTLTPPIPVNPPTLSTPTAPSQISGPTSPILPMPVRQPTTATLPTTVSQPTPTLPTPESQPSPPSGPTPGRPSSPAKPSSPSSSVTSNSKPSSLTSNSKPSSPSSGFSSNSKSSKAKKKNKGTKSIKRRKKTSKGKGSRRLRHQ